MSKETLSGEPPKPPCQDSNT